MCWCILRLCPIEVILSSVPHMIVVGIRSKALMTANLSRPSKFGKNSATTSNGVFASIESTNST